MATETGKKKDDEKDEKRETSASGNPLLKKLSAKIIMGDIKIGQKFILEQGGDKGQVDLFQIMGNATDTKVGESNFGKWTALIGQFRSVNMFTGEVLEAAKVFLPGILEEMILGKMAGQGSEGRGVLFAFTVGIKLDETPNSAKGYTYYAKPLVHPQADDPFQKLIAQVPAPKPQKLIAKSDK